MTRALLTMVLKGSGMIGMELPKLYHGLADFRYKSFERQSLVIQWCSGAVDRGAAKPYLVTAWLFVNGYQDTLPKILPKNSQVACR